MAQVQRLESQPERLWREYVELKKKADLSESIDDGVAAGRAWSAFLAEFVSDRGTRAAVHGDAIGSK